MYLPHTVPNPLPMDLPEVIPASSELAMQDDVINSVIEQNFDSDSVTEPSNVLDFKTELSLDSQPHEQWSPPPFQEAASLPSTSAVPPVKTWYPESWMSVCRTEDTKIGIVVPTATLQSF